jgi:hypothetical protein
VGAEEELTMTEKFRADQVGSLLRPEALHAARRGHDAAVRFAW